MSKIPKIRNGKLAEGRGLPYEACLLIQAMVAGTDTEGLMYSRDSRVEPEVPIPTGVPLTLNMAAKVRDMSRKMARRYEAMPEFQKALREATEAYRASWELGSVRMALEVRDDPENKPRERISAAQFLRGADPVSAFTLSVTQNNATVAASAGYVVGRYQPEPVPVGYVVDLSEKKPAAAPAIEGCAATIDASSRTTAGDLAEDVARERAAEKVVRLRRE